MSVEQTACEDLKAFERRLTEIVSGLQPIAQRWRFLLFIVSLCTAISAWYWLCDPVTMHVSLLQSLHNHCLFTLSSTLLVVLFMVGIHSRVVAPSVVCSRTRRVLADFNMWCDDSGKLILKPRPPVM